MIPARMGWTPSLVWSQQQGQPQPRPGVALDGHDGGTGGPQGEGAVGGQVGDIQGAEGEVEGQGHKAVDEALLHGALKDE